MNSARTSALGEVDDVVFYQTVPGYRDSCTCLEYYAVIHDHRVISDDAVVGNDDRAFFGINQRVADDPGVRAFLVDSSPALDALDQAVFDCRATINEDSDGQIGSHPYAVNYRPGTIRQYPIIKSIHGAVAHRHGASGVDAKGVFFTPP